MRIILRILSVIMWLAVIGTLFLIRRIWHFGGIARLMSAGFFGFSTFLGWLLVLAVGPFAAVQLWRLRESGRISSLLLAGYTFLYYVAGWVTSGQRRLVTPKLWFAIAGNACIVLLLLSPYARKICKGPNAETRHASEKIREA